MSLWVQIAVVAAAVFVAVLLLYVVRQRMRTDTILAEPNRLDPHYGLVSTAFAVLLAFVVLGSFQSYNLGKSGAESEAVAVVELFRTAEFFPPADRVEFEREMMCLARATVAEWPYMRDGETNPAVEDWVARLQTTTTEIDASNPTQQAALSHLLSAADQRATGRRERLSEVSPAVTTPVWFTLVVGGLAVVLAPLLFTNRRESFAVQAGLTGAVTVMVSSGLMLVWFLDHPYRDQSGSIKPTEMQRSIATMEAANPRLAPPCTANGNFARSEPA